MNEIKNPFESGAKIVDEVEKKKNEHAFVMWQALCGEMLPMSAKEMVKRYAHSKNAEERTKVAILGTVERCVAFGWNKTRPAEVNRIKDFLWKYGQIEEKRLGTGEGAVVSQTLGFRKTFVGKEDFLEAKNEKNAFCESFVKHYAAEFENLNAKTVNATKEKTRSK